MPTVRIGGYMCYFVSYDCIEPPHIHLAKGRERRAPTAKFWLDPVVLQNSRGLNASELRSAQRIVEENRALFLEMWHEHCNNRSSASR
ncbi:MAG: DUF4160 domain-containing protein [Caldilineaceae bacterium]|nr:DUF4160 domain-containing protein [Caldilineaceae bacterium]MCB9156402.1 DUF4160 domain-containing protein [Caldilineaceae bacterium]MCB9156516.1 DUF4160 domain-containing protein [Caldilineaceae bacterium]